MSRRVALVCVVVTLGACDRQPLTPVAPQDSSATEPAPPASESQKPKTPAELVGRWFTTEELESGKRSKALLWKWIRFDPDLRCDAVRDLRGQEQAAVTRQTAFDPAAKTFEMYQAGPRGMKLTYCKGTWSVEKDRLVLRFNIGDVPAPGQKDEAEYVVTMTRDRE